MNITLDVRRNVFCTTRFTLDEWNLTFNERKLTIDERRFVSCKPNLIVCVLNTIVCVLMSVINEMNLVFLNLKNVIKLPAN